MIVARRATLVARADDIVGDTLAQTLVEHKVLSNELVFDLLFLDLPRVLDDSTAQLIDVVKTFMPHPGTCLFTSDAACAIHENVLVAMVSPEIFDPLGCSPDRVYARQ